MPETLKPCPANSTWKDHDHPFEIGVRRVFNQRFAVGCECGLIGPSQITESEAVAAWNTRHQDAVIEAAQKVADEWRDSDFTRDISRNTEIEPLIGALAALLKEQPK